MKNEIRELIAKELDEVAGGNPILLGAAGFLAAKMAEQIATEVGLTDAIDFGKMEAWAKSQQKPA
jgi:hypothetical protein